MPSLRSVRIGLGSEKRNREAKDKLGLPDAKELPPDLYE